LAIVLSHFFSKKIHFL